MRKWIVCALGLAAVLAVRPSGATSKNGHLAVTRPGKPERTFVAETPDVFFEPRQPRTRRIFQRSADGAIVGFVDRREARDISWKQIADNRSNRLQ